MVVLLIAFALRMWDIDARSLWFDESIEYWIATSRINELLINAWEGLNDPPLYVFLLHWWMKIGQSELFLRFPSVCFSLLSVVGVSILTRKLFGQKASLIAAGLITVLPSEIRYAQEVGEYALMVCAITFCLIAWLKVTKERSWYDYILWTMAALLATYSYYYAIFPVGVLFALIVVEGYIRSRLDGLVKPSISLSLYGIGISPLIQLFLSRYGLSSALINIEQTNLRIELSNLFGGTAKNLLGFQLVGWPWTGISDPILLLLIATLVLLIIANLSGYPKQWLMLLVLTWLAYFLVGRARTFGFRYGLILTPMLIPTIAQGISMALANKYYRLIGIFALASVLILGTISLPNRVFREWVYPNSNWPWPEIQDMRQVVKFWLEHRIQSQYTYVYYGSVPAFRYYLKQYGQEMGDIPPMWYANCWSQSAPDYCAADNVFYGAWIRSRPPETKLDSIWKTLGLQPSQLWLVFSHIYPGEKESILSGLNEQYRTSLAYERNGASAYLLERR